MAPSSAFAFVPDAWDTLRDEAMRAEATVAVHPDVARWRAYRALDMVLATIEAYEGFPPQHRPLAERLTHGAFNTWLKSHPAPVKMWMHRIRQAGMVGAHVDSEWARSVEDAQRVVETVHKLLWWLVDTYDTVPADERPPITWSALDTPSLSEEEHTGAASPNEPDAASEAPTAPTASASAPDETAPSTNVRNDEVRQWIAALRQAAPHTPAAQRAAQRVLKHIHAANASLLTPFSTDA